MPCSCNENRASSGSTSTATAAAVSAASGTSAQAAADSASTVLRSVCDTNPCSTSRNIAQIESGFCPPSGTDCTPFYPELTQEELLQQRDYRPCTDENGCTGYFPAECRNTFWPSFAHPRWLCCRDLYCNNRR